MIFSGAPIAFEFAGRHWQLAALGDLAITLELCEQHINQANCAAVARLHGALRPKQAQIGFSALIPAYASLTLMLRRGANLPDSGALLLQFLLADAAQLADSAAAINVVELALLPEPGLDAPMLADAFGLSVSQLLQQFCAADYQVAQIGFRAGFPYLIGLPPPLSYPRRAVLRAHVPALSVAIGGAQAGIYPAAGPGGWHVIGQIAQSLFDPQGFAERAGAPCWLAPGDHVRFRPAT